MIAASAALAAMGWYGVEWTRNDRAPGGGSLSGLAFGIAAGLICVFEMALVLRKTSWFRTRRRLLGLIPLGTARTWMAAHIWLGLLAVPLVFMHSGFRWGGPMSSVLAGLFAIVIVSGVCGLVLQNLLPRIITEGVPEESIYSQIDELGRQFAVDAVRLAQKYGGPGPPGMWDEFERAEFERETARFGHATVVGAPRRVGTMAARTTHADETLQRSVAAPELHHALHEHVVTFLRTGRSQTLHFTNEQRIAWYFDDLRRRVLPEVVPAVDQIERLCHRRRQLNRQARLHVWLHGWLSIHLPLSVAFMWLLVAHVIGALVYS